MFCTYSPLASSLVIMKVMRAPVATGVKVAKTNTFRNVPLGLKAFVGLTQAAVSTRFAPYCAFEIFKSSQVCSSSLNCARALPGINRQDQQARMRRRKLRVVLMRNSFHRVGRWRLTFLLAQVQHGIDIRVFKHLQLCTQHVG